MSQIKNNKSICLLHFGNKEKSGEQIYEKLNQYHYSVEEFVVTDEFENIEKLHLYEIVIINIAPIHNVSDVVFDKIILNHDSVIINEAEFTNKLKGQERKSWERHLLNKIDSKNTVIPAFIKSKEGRLKGVNLTQFGIVQSWILAASIGGPEALTKFLSGFEGNEKLFFIVIQHLSEKELLNLARQLNVKSKLNVVVPVSGMKIQPGMVVVHPSDELLCINNDGELELSVMNNQTPFSPCIDECSVKLLDNIENLNMAVFSGMSSDGVLAALKVFNKKNRVITQSEKSCVVSSIINGINNKIPVNFMGSPLEMAKYIKGINSEL